MEEELRRVKADGKPEKSECNKASRERGTHLSAKEATATVTVLRPSSISRGRDKIEGGGRAEGRRGRDRGCCLRNTRFVIGTRNGVIFPFSARDRFPRSLDYGTKAALLE